MHAPTLPRSHAPGAPTTLHALAYDSLVAIAHLRKDTYLPAVLFDVAAERIRQDQLVDKGKHPFSCANSVVRDLPKLPILAEEFGEVAKALYEYTFLGSELDLNQQRHHLRAELIQLAAVAVAWAESLTPPLTDAPRS